MKEDLGRFDANFFNIKASEAKVTTIPRVFGRQRVTK